MQRKDYKYNFAFFDREMVMANLCASRRDEILAAVCVYIFAQSPFYVNIYVYIRTLYDMKPMYGVNRRSIHRPCRK